MGESRGTKVLSNGAVYDLDKGRIVANPGGGTTAITRENSSEMQARRYELAAERVAAGANAAVAKHRKFGKIFDGADLDFVEAGAEAVMSKALEQDDPKQVDAWRAILQESRLSQPKAGAIVADPVDTVRDILRSLAEVARAAAQAGKNEA